MPIKSNMTKPDRKRKVKVNRKVPAMVINILEEVAEEVIEEVVEDVKDAVIEVIEDVVEVLEDFVENIVLSHLEPLEESRSLPPPPTDEDYVHPDCPVSPCASPTKRCKKVIEPKPLRNSEGLYLNPRTNRYVKTGTSAFKQLIKDGVIILE